MYTFLTNHMDVKAMKLKTLFTLLCCMFAVQSHAVVNVEPNIVRVKVPGKVGKLIVKNTGVIAESVQVYVKQWTQAPDGTDVLNDTKDVVVFPRVFKLKPGQEKRILIALKAPRKTDVEQSYRVIVHQLVPRGSRAEQIGVELKHSLPVLFRPVRENMSWNVTGIRYEGRQLRVDTENTGNRHVMFRQFQVKAKDATGAVKWERNFPGWYVKPGNNISFRLGLPVPQNDCLAITQAEVTVLPGNGERDVPDKFREARTFNLPVTNNGCS